MYLTKRSLLNELQLVTNSYFPYRPPKVRWKELSYSGLADTDKNTIYLNPEISASNVIGCKVGCGIYYKPKTKLKFKEGEQYFLVLLHEIGHFKVKLKPSLEWIKLKRKYHRDARDYLKIEKEKLARFGLKRMTKKEERQFIHNHIDYCAALKRKKGEKEIDYDGRNEDFRHWLFGGAVSEHMEVENWAITQFKKKRTEIRRILAED